MTHAHFRHISGRAIGFALISILGVCLVSASAHAVAVLYTGTFRTINRLGQTPPVPPAQPPSFGGVLNLTSMGGITIAPNDANFVSTVVWTNPPTFAGVLQLTSVVSLMNPLKATAKPGNGPGPFTFAFPSPTGSPPVNPTYGVTKRLGAVSLAGGGNNFGGTLAFLFNYQASLVFYGGGGGAPNLACPAVLPGSPGKAFVATNMATCVGLTTGPLPAMTLPSVMVPQQLTVTGFSATTRAVFAGAPAPIATTTLTATGSDMRGSGGATGMIQLVAPWLYATQNGLPTGPAGQNQGATITEITLSLLPEPGGALALLGGIAALVVLWCADQRAFPAPVDASRVRVFPRRRTRR